MPVYAIGMEDAPNLTKIGWATSPEDRLKQLQTGSPYKLHLAWQIDVPRYVETITHRELHKYRLDGEWFQVSPEAAFGALQEALTRNSADLTPAMLLVVPRVDARLEYRRLRLSDFNQDVDERRSLDRFRQQLLEEIKAVDHLMLLCAIQLEAYEMGLEKLGEPPTTPNSSEPSGVEVEAA